MLASPVARLWHEMHKRTSRTRGFLCAATLGLCALFFSPASVAYEVGDGDMVLRVNTGARVQVRRLETVTRETPPAALLFGGGFDLAIIESFAFASHLQLAFSPNFIDTELAAGARYRLRALNAQIIPFVGLKGLLHIGVPLNRGEAHFGLGLLPEIGSEYFFTRTLAISALISFRANNLFFPEAKIELAPQASLGITWRF